jgi:hypothetical protein
MRIRQHPSCTVEPIAFTLRRRDPAALSWPHEPRALTRGFTSMPRASFVATRSDLDYSYRDLGVDRPESLALATAEY